MLKGFSYPLTLEQSDEVMLGGRYLRRGGGLGAAKIQTYVRSRFGPVDGVKYAETFEAVGFRVDASDQIGQRPKKTFEIPGPVLIGIRVDYRDNH